MNGNYPPGVEDDPSAPFNTIEVEISFNLDLLIEGEIETSPYYTDNDIEEYKETTKREVKSFIEDNYNLIVTEI